MFRSSFIALALPLCLAFAATGQEADPAENATFRQFTVELTSVTLSDVDEADAKRLLAGAEERGETLRKLEEAGKLKVHEQIVLTAVENQPTRVQFGKRVAMVTGTNFGRGLGNPPVRSFQFENIGTLVQVVARLQGEDEAVAELTYEDSRREPAQDEDVPAAVATTMVNTTLHLKLGEPTVVNSRKAGDLSLLLVSIDVPEPQRGAGQAAIRLRPAPESAARPGDSDARLEQFARGLLSRYDRDGDGVLDQDEMREARLLASSIADYDANEDGRLSLEELVDFLKRRTRDRDR